MLTIIHGNDYQTSRKFFLDQKDNESITFDAETLLISEIEQSLQGFGLFENSKKIFIENLFTRKGSKSQISIIDVLSNFPKETQVFVWSDKDLPAKILSTFPKHEVQNFKIPSNIWTFVDGIKPMSNSNVSLFHQAISSTEPEIVFAMIIRQFRLMLGLLEESRSNIDEIKRIAPWQKSKLLRQSSMFTVEKLKQIYRKLYKIDKAQKTGSSNLNLVQSIDIFLLEI